MTSATNALESIQQDSFTLLVESKCIRHTLHLDLATRIHKKTYADLLERVKRLDPSTQQSHIPILRLAKIEKWLALADRLIAFQRSPSTGLAPLVERLIRKVEKIKSKIPGCPPDQTQQFADKLRSLHNELEREAPDKCNEETRLQIASTLALNRSLELQLAKIKPNIYKPSSSFSKILDYCPGVAAHLSMIFLKELLEDPRSHKLHYCFSQILGRAIDDAIAQPSVSCSEICDDHHLQLIGVPKQQFPLSAVEISKRLDHCHGKMGIVFSSGKLAVPATIFENGMIKILKIAGDETSGYKPYFIACGTQSQAVENIFNCLSANSGTTFETTLVGLRAEESSSSSESESSAEASEPEDAEEVKIPRLIPELQTLIDGFSQGLEPVVDMNSQLLCRPIFHADPQKGVARDRIYFHLYHLHDKETPHKVIRSDFDHGKNAFHIGGRATSEEKLRAVKRTTLEMLLDEALHATEENNNIFFLNVFELIKNLSQDKRDLPEGMASVADAYFARLLQLSPLTPSTLFLLNPINFMSKEHKLQALSEIVTSLRKTWKLT